MHKRLEEIVIYILENSAGLEPDQKAQLEEMRDQLRLGTFPSVEVEQVLQHLVDFSVDEGGVLSIGENSSPVESQIPLDPKAAEYLGRLIDLGLIDREQEEELFLRAGRLEGEMITLEGMQFLTASLIFDQRLASGQIWDEYKNERGYSLH